MYYDFHEWIVRISMINKLLEESFIETLLRGSENRCDFNGDLVIPIKYGWDAELSNASATIQVSFQRISRKQRPIAFWDAQLFFAHDFIVYLQSHYSIKQAGAVLGLGADNVVAIKCDER
jgi:hypothetical protein